MALDDKKEQLSGSGDSLSRETEVPKASIPEPKKEIDTSIWGDNKYLKGASLRNYLRSDEAWRKTNLGEKDRMEIGEKLFGKGGDYGDYLDKTKGEKTLKRLEKEKAYASTDLDRKRIDKEIRVAKSILGK